MKKILLIISYLIEAILLLFWIILCKIIGIKLSSFVGGKIVQFIGPLTKLDNIANSNLTKVFPNLSNKKISIIKNNMWNNIGRNTGELIFANKLNPYLDKKKFSIIGKKYLEDLKKNKSGAILFSAHIGNWEICPLIITRRGEEVTSIYRHANNPITEKIIQRLRKGICLYAPKGPKGANTLFKVLRQKKYAAILADQKLNEGESIKFLGHPAKTATAIAELSIRLSVPIIPVHVERIKGVKFKYIVEKPIKVDNKKMNHDDKVKMILLKINNKIEKWILKNPEQWLWIHNRWEK